MSQLISFLFSAKETKAQITDYLSPRSYSYVAEPGLNPSIPASQLGPRRLQISEFVLFLLAAEAAGELVCLPSTAHDVVPLPLKGFPETQMHKEQHCSAAPGG